MTANDKRVSLYLQRIAEAEVPKAIARRDWVRNWTRYRNKERVPMVPNMAWKKNVPIPDAFRIIETMVPQQINGMFSDPNWFSVVAPTQAGDEYRSVVKSLLLDGWEGAHMFEKAVIGTKYGMICGSVCYKTVWEKVVGDQEVLEVDADRLDFTGEALAPQLQRTHRERVLFNGPQVYVVDLQNLWFDPTGPDQLGRFNWVVERIPMDVGKMSYQNKKFGGTLYNQAAINRAKKGGSGSLGMKTPHSVDRVIRSGGAYSSGPYDVGSLLQSIDGIPDAMPENYAEMLQCWGWIDPMVKKYDDTQWRLVKILNSQEVVSDNPIPSPDLRPPYILNHAVPVPHSLYGESVLTQVGPLMELRSFLESARKEEVMQHLFPPTLVREEVNMSPDAMLYKPGGIRYVSGFLGPLSEAMQVMEQKPVMQEAYAESSIKEDQILKTTGATEVFQGSFAGGRRTATEFAGTMQVGMGRFALGAAYADEVMKRPILELMFKLFQTRLDQKKIVDAGEFGRYGIDLLDIQYGIDIRVDSGKFGSLDQARANSMMQWYGMFANNPNAAQWLNDPEWIREIMHMQGIPRTERLVKGDDVVAQQMAEQQQMVEGQAQAEHQRGLETETLRGSMRGGSGAGSGGGNVVPLSRAAA